MMDFTGFTGFKRVLLGFTRFLLDLYRVSLGFTEFYWVFSLAVEAQTR